MNKIKFKPFGATMAIGIIALFGLLPLSSAKVIAEGRGFALSPMNQSIVLIPGETYRGSIDVINPSDSGIELYYAATVGAYGVKGDDNSLDDYADVTIDVNSSGYSQISDWIELENETGVLSPNESATISFIITVPENAPGGGQYATILVQENAPAEDSSNSDSSIKEVMRMASVIYAEIAGDTIKEGEIISNDIPTFSLSNKIEATSMVKNDGNIHTNAEYTLQIWPLFSDEEIYTNEEDPAKSTVLPETKRYYVESYDLTMPGIYKVRQVVKIFGEESTVEKFVVYCPIWLLFIILFVIVGIIAWLISKSKKRKKSDR